MNYRESEREKSLRIRDEYFQDPGYGKHLGKPYSFVLADPKKNLWSKIRKEKIDYFKQNDIVWWSGGNDPSGHLLSSQVSCLNHLFILRNDKNAALSILKSLDSTFKDVCRDFDGGFIGFEVVSNGSYLNEVSHGSIQTRGANCTSIDAMMTGIQNNDKKVQVIIEWKYTEFYQNDFKGKGTAGNTRKARYDRFINDPKSPLKTNVALDNYYYEPFYQLMRQTLLGWQMVENKNQELNADDWLHYDVIPENNLHLRYKVQAPDFIQDSLKIAWKAQLKNPDKYNIITPQRLLSPLIYNSTYKSLINYLDYRYW